MIEGPLQAGGAAGQYAGGQEGREGVSRAGAAPEAVGEEWKEGACWEEGRREVEQKGEDRVDPEQEVVVGIEVASLGEQGRA